MNAYTMESIKIGMEESFEVEITQDMQDQFTKLSQDINPMHLSAEYAQEYGFKGRLVYGMLTASYYSTLVGVYLPGRYCLIYECNSRFHKPIYIGDRLIVKGIVTEINRAFNRVTIKASIKNYYGETVSQAKIIVGILKAED